jgi:hypothetical protein
MIPKSKQNLRDALNWAVESESDASMATADWLTQDANASYMSVFNMLNDPAVPIMTLVQLKEAFKAWRIMGESSRDRRMAACCYALVIAAGLVHHGRRISSQSDSALRRSLLAIRADHLCADKVRGLIDQAIRLIDSKQLK